MRTGMISFVVTLALLLVAGFTWQHMQPSDQPAAGVTEAVYYPGPTQTLADLSIPLDNVTLAPAAALAEVPLLRPADTSPEPEPEGQRAQPRGITVGADDDEVSPEVREAFADAVAEFGIDDVLQPSLPQPADDRTEPSQELPTVADLPSDVRQQLPELSYDSHMYGGSRERWIRLDGRTLREGEQIGDLRVITIEASYTIFGFQNDMFQVEALEDIRP